MANVLSLVPYNIFPAKTGGQKGIALFNRYFSAFHNLICVTVRSNDPSFAKYTVLNILADSRLRYVNVFYFFTLRRIIKKNQVSTVIIEHPYYGWLGILLKRFCHVQLIVHSHNIETSRFKSVGKWWWRLLRRYEKFVHLRADHTFCISNEDRQYMIRHFCIKADKCTVITYGIEWDHAPGQEERAEAKNILQKIHNISPGTSLFFFNGTLDYPPNSAAVTAIVADINPLLLQMQLAYRIIICGKNLPLHMNGLNQYAGLNIIYAGFVEDINIYFKGTDVFINPITDGGGIKTKLVEALGCNLTAVSTASGATGVDEDLCNGKLLLVKDHDWETFAANMKHASQLSLTITGAYFEHFYWENIALKAAGIIKG